MGHLQNKTRPRAEQTRKKDKYPLRKIIQILRGSDNLFGRDHALLECGHEVLCSGGLRARCKKCFEQNNLTDK